MERQQEPRCLLAYDPTIGRCTQSDPVCESLVEGGMAVGLVCLLHPDLCEYAADKLCEDTTETFKGMFGERKDYKPRKPGRKKTRLSVW